MPWQPHVSRAFPLEVGEVGDKADASLQVSSPGRSGSLLPCLPHHQSAPESLLAC